MKIALIQDWLTEMGGAEKVFKSLIEIYPDADIFTLVYHDDILEKMGITKDKVKASFIQKLPFAKTKYRNYLPFFTLAIESFDLSDYDLIISSSYCVAKGVLVNSSQIHICYCHSPVRYAWDLHHQYIREAGLKTGIKGFIVKYFLSKLRIWDVSSSNRVDHFISNSDYIKKRIEKVYRRKADTIYPPVDVFDFELTEKKEDFYFTCSRMVPYKKIDLIVASFNKMPDKKLVVIGSGPDYNKIQKIAGHNILLLGYQPFEILKEYMQKAKAFVFAAEEDFGIVPVEAQACGTPVIAYGKGGSLETVIDNETGVLFFSQTTESIQDAVNRYEQIANVFDVKRIRANAEKFSNTHFSKEINSYVLKKYNEFKRDL